MTPRFLPGGARARGVGSREGTVAIAEHGNGRLKRHTLPSSQPLSCWPQVVRAPVGLAVVKVLRLVPEDDRTAALPRVLTSVANLLKARQQGVR